MAEESNTPSEQEASQTEGQAGVKFGMQRVYLKDLSFESPLGVESFKQTGGWSPKINQDLNTMVNKVAEDVYEVILKITVNVEESEKTIFLTEVQQAGIFTISNVEQKQLAHILNARCPEMLFPYAREVIDSCAVKGGFPAVMLPPINFDVLFMQAVQRASQQAQAAQAEKNSGDVTSN